MAGWERHPVTDDHHTVPNGGHRFGPDLVCGAKGCHWTWEAQQYIFMECIGVLPSAKPKRFRRGVQPTSELGKCCQLHGITQGDIAAQAHAGCTGVSIVMRGASGASDEMVERVEGACFELLAEKGVPLDEMPKGTREGTE